MSYGPLPLPVPVPGSADPLVDTLLAFCAAVFTAKAGAAWSQVSPDPLAPVVAATYPWDPQTSFVDRPAPALHIWRSEMRAAVWKGQEMRVRPGTLMLNWVFPPVPQDKQRVRDPYLNAVASAFDDSLEWYGRDPSWIVPGDTDPSAAYQGSLLWAFLPNLYELKVNRARRVPLLIRLKDSSVPMPYSCVEMELAIQELDTPDLSRWDDMGGVNFTAKQGGDSDSKAYPGQFRP